MKGATTLHRHRIPPLKVSIHAPVKGATPPAKREGRGMTGFNPRPREGGDCFFTALSDIPKSFQSTPP